MAATDRQTEVLEFIREFIDEKSYPPTTREIGLALDIKSPNGVMCHLKALEKKRLIVREPYLSRSIRIVEDKATDDVDALLEKIDRLTVENAALVARLAECGVKA